MFCFAKSSCPNSSQTASSDPASLPRPLCHSRASWSPQPSSLCPGTVSPDPCTLAREGRALGVMERKWLSGRGWSKGNFRSSSAQTAASQADFLPASPRQVTTSARLLAAVSSHCFSWRMPRQAHSLLGLFPLSSNHHSVGSLWMLGWSLSAGRTLLCQGRAGQPSTQGTGLLLAGTAVPPCPPSVRGQLAEPCSRQGIEGRQVPRAPHSPYQQPGRRTRPQAGSLVPSTPGSRSW